MMSVTIQILLNMNKLTRKQIRYICFRIQTEKNGGEKVGELKFADEVKEHIESQDCFGGWEKFAQTWDVDEKAPLVVVIRTISIQSEWNKIVEKEARELPKSELPKPQEKKHKKGKSWQQN